MECDLCTEHLDGAERVPKVLPCGHSACIQCLRRLPDARCPTCRRDFTGPPEGLPTNFLALKLLEGRRLDRCPLGWCSGCRAAATPRCWEDHDVVSVRSAMRRQLQDALPQAAEQLQGLQDKCPDEQALPALTLLTGESWAVSLRGGGRELTGTVRNTEEPLTKALWLLLAARAALTEDRVAARDAPPAAAPPAAAPPAAAPPAAAPPAAAPPAAAPPAAAPPAAAPPAAAPPATLLDQLRRLGEMDVTIFSRSRPDAMLQQKADAMRAAPGVTRLVGVCCYPDMVWSLQLMYRAAPSVEQLSVDGALVTHLRAVLAMPRLRRLKMWDDGPLFGPSWLIPPIQRVELELPPGHTGLQWLSVENVLYVDVQVLLLAHGHSLEVLQMRADCSKDDVWWMERPLLEECGLLALRKLVLMRFGADHEAGQCGQQRAQLRRALPGPGTEVLCDVCDGDEVREDF
ncbi:uncharacterized protein LOC113212093 isoform X1 [Frankliniella occidentalis]|uniref:Uncharacterized protein LOC113212093 isoform X1 n=1 Tax=Frankliniella occidentalis TaxID=133901 RepID=A0A9C6U3B0_FRAOC|nr:uncharacterized protein LOC113212093 isoform X1 [Frankliniella occidentalis]